MNFKCVNKGLTNINSDVPPGDMDISRNQPHPAILKCATYQAFILRVNPPTVRIKE